MDAKYCLTKAAEIKKKKEALGEKIMTFSQKLDKATKSSVDRGYEVAYNKLHALNYDSLSTFLEMRTAYFIFLNKEDEFGIFNKENCDLFSQLLTLQREFNFWKNIAPDSSPMRFDGGIIITDPCYLRDDDNDDDEFDCYDWAEDNGICKSTLYGDWSCTTYDTDLKKDIGKFCADSGMVCVVKLEDVLKINPNFNYHLERPWTTTYIPDFHGYIYSSVEQEKYFDYEDGEEVEEYTLHIIGLGNINFKTMQTGW